MFDKNLIPELPKSGFTDHQWGKLKLVTWLLSFVFSDRIVILRSVERILLMTTHIWELLWESGELCKRTTAVPSTWLSPCCSIAYSHQLILRDCRCRGTFHCSWFYFQGQNPKENFLKRRWGQFAWNYRLPTPFLVSKRDGSSKARIKLLSPHLLDTLGVKVRT